MVKLLLALLLMLPPLTLQAVDREFDCLVRNVYQEARGEPYKGKVAVALVTINRTKSERFPSTICGVVYQRGQFSWTRNYAKVRVDPVVWQAAKDAAFSAYMGVETLGGFKATHFHNTSVNPGWKMKKVAVLILGCLFFGCFNLMGQM